jgi:hypothetical protein
MDPAARERLWDEVDAISDLDDETRARFFGEPAPREDEEDKPWRLN